MHDEKHTCEFLEFLDFLGKKWAYAILTNIGDKPITYNQLYALSKHMINPTLLSGRLKDMMRYKLVLKDETSGKITYTITSAGKELKKILFGMKDWALQNQFIIPDKCKNKECICDIVFVGKQGK